jgi:CDGSH-type Zn-finger protein
MEVPVLRTAISQFRGLSLKKQQIIFHERGVIPPRSKFMEPTIAQKTPIPVELQAGKTIYWCACGRSANQPYCDGSHTGSAFAPKPYTPTASGTAYLCACKQSKNAPLCDGSHKSL